jgi:alpha-beta hydrolase superfamily lysophospholipase
LPSEDTAREDARAAWTWLAARHPQQRRYIFGHSLGGAIGIDLAASVQDESGVIVEGTFTSISDVVSSFKWGWLPFEPFITQPFDAHRKVKDIGAPLLVVHGALDNLIRPELGRKLYDAATDPKMFVLVKGGSHHSTNTVGGTEYRAAVNNCSASRRLTPQRRSSKRRLAPRRHEPRPCAPTTPAARSDHRASRA